MNRILCGLLPIVVLMGLLACSSAEKQEPLGYRTIEREEIPLEPSPLLYEPIIIGSVPVNDSSRLGADWDAYYQSSTAVSTAGDSSSYSDPILDYYAEQSPPRSDSSVHTYIYAYGYPYWYYDDPYNPFWDDDWYSFRYGPRYRSYYYSYGWYPYSWGYPYGWWHHPIYIYYPRDPGTRAPRPSGEVRTPEPVINPPRLATPRDESQETKEERTVRNWSQPRTSSALVPNRRSSFSDETSLPPSLRAPRSDLRSDLERMMPRIVDPSTRRDRLGLESAPQIYSGPSRNPNSFFRPELSAPRSGDLGPSFRVELPSSDRFLMPSAPRSGFSSPRIDVPMREPSISAERSRSDGGMRNPVMSSPRSMSISPSRAR